MEAWPNFDTEPGSGPAAADRRCPGRLAGECRPWCRQAVGLAVRCRSADPWPARHGPGEFTTVGGQRLADGHVPGHIGQPPGRGPGRPPATARGGLGVQPFAAISTPLACSISQRCSMQSRDLAWVPIPRLAGVDVQGADHPTVQLHPCSRSPTRPSSCSRLIGLADAGRRRGAAALGQRVGPDAQAVEDGQERLAQGPCAVAFSQRLPAAIRNIKLSRTGKSSPRSWWARGSARP
jgi:hypothetical protein